MKRAVELFTFERQTSRSSVVEEIWQTCSEPAASFTSVAVSRWKMVLTRACGTARLTVRGPETRATTVPIPVEAEFLGIEFSLGTYMPGLPPGPLVDDALTLPSTNGSVWLDGSAWELPRPENADVFVDRLVRAGLLVHDPVVEAARRGELEGLSKRSVERRVSRATGLTLSTIRQIQRAEQAAAMLCAGVPLLDAAGRAGFADQPHLTRSLKRYFGQTPSRIAASTREG